MQTIHNVLMSSLNPVSLRKPLLMETLTLNLSSPLIRHSPHLRSRFMSWFSSTSVARAPMPAIAFGTWPVMSRAQDFPISGNEFHLFICFFSEILIFFVNLVILRCLFFDKFRHGWSFGGVHHWEEQGDRVSSLVGTESHFIFLSSILYSLHCLMLILMVVSSNSC